MSHSPTRRLFLLTAASIPMVSVYASLERRGEKNASSAMEALVKLEKTLDGRLGLFALDTANGDQLGHRASERFPVCSTFKAILVAAILDRSKGALEFIRQRVTYTQNDLVEYSPMTEKHVGEGMTIADLCAAALQYSDNTAGNLLMRMLGGPTAVTVFARSIGDPEFRLDRWETDINTALPGDLRDTSTPEAMGLSLQRLVLGDVLAPYQRNQLRDWLCGSTTGATRIKAGIPAEWKIGDKTGGGQYGTANDIAVIWPTNRVPVIVSIYTTQNDINAKARNDIIASAARIVVDWLG